MLNGSGVLVGFASLLIIGVFHPIVIKCEYHFTDRVWPVFLVLGLLCAGASLFVENHVASDLLGILGFVLLWCIHELKQQRRRVKRGWFPENPKRRQTPH